jgi:hypothetical protein
MTKPTLDLSEARTLVLQRRYEIPEEWLEPDFLLPSEETRCVDEREHRWLPTPGQEMGQEQKLPLVALPGAGLGIAITIFTALHSLEVERRRAFNLNLRQVVRELEEIYGPPSFHTDTHSANNVLPCAGCGHCSGALSRAGMSDEAKNFLREDYIPGLISRGVVPAIYEGSHDASAVMIIKSMEIGLLPRVNLPGDHPSFYVFNQGWQKRLVRRAANQIYFRVIRKSLPDVTIGEFIDKVAYEAAKRQLGYTLEKLAADLPKYVVKLDQNAQIVVEKASKRVPI